MVDMCFRCFWLLAVIHLGLKSNERDKNVRISHLYSNLSFLYTMQNWFFWLLSCILDNFQKWDLWTLNELQFGAGWVVVWQICMHFLANITQKRLIYLLYINIWTWNSCLSSQGPQGSNFLESLSQTCIFVYYDEGRS
jgi:hypothetical protein